MRLVDTAYLPGGVLYEEKGEIEKIVRNFHFNLQLETQLVCISVKYIYVT